MTNTTTNADKDEVVVTARPIVKPGMEKEFEAAFQKAVGHTRSEPGVIAFEIYRIKDKTGHYLLVERYKNHAALESHLAQSSTQELFEVLHRTMTQPAEELIEFAAELFPAGNLNTVEEGNESHWPLDTHHRQ